MRLRAMSGCLLASIVVGLFAVPVYAGHPFAHTHIGKNPTWRPDWSDPGNPNLAIDPDPSDDGKLWMFSIPPIHPTAPTPGWPNWGDPGEPAFLLLAQELVGGQAVHKPGEPNKLLFTCRFMYGQAGYGDPDGLLHLDGWHSAHGPQGAWDLEPGDVGHEPAWDISLKRASTSLADPTDFLMMRPDETIVLAADGDTYRFADYDEKEWMPEYNAWGIHSHMGFYFWLDDPRPDDVFAATFSVFDNGGLYEPSDGFEFRFRVPEPTSLGLLIVGALAVRRAKRE